MTIKMKTARKTAEQATTEVEPAATEVKTGINYIPPTPRTEPKPDQGAYEHAKTVETTPFGQTIYRF